MKATRVRYPNNIRPGDTVLSVGLNFFYYGEVVQVGEDTLGQTTLSTRRNYWAVSTYHRVFKLKGSLPFRTVEPISALEPYLEELNL